MLFAFFIFEPEPDKGLVQGIERRNTYFTTPTITFGVNPELPIIKMISRRNISV